MEWYLRVIKQYAVFTGRARRKEYWMFVLFNAVFAFVAGAIDGVLGTLMVFSTLYGLAVLIPSLAVSVRRLHDINKSGWFVLVALIPLIGAIWLVILLATDSTPGKNMYGANPKEASAE